MPDHWCKWYGHYLNDEFQKKLMQTSWWSQITLCREQWIGKMKSRQLPVNMGYKELMEWVKQSENKLIDNSGRKTIARWTKEDNKEWREEMEHAINSNFNGSDKQEMLKLAQRSQLIWNALDEFMAMIAK